MKNRKTIIMSSLKDITEGSSPDKVFPSWSEIGFVPSRSGAVLVPLILNGSSPNVLFLERQNFLRRHPGEISFPGGEKETSDLSPVDTAIRETCEELGINKDSIHILCSLAPEETIVSNFLVYPFVGILKEISSLDGLLLDQEEIAGAFLVDPFVSSIKLVQKEFVHENRLIRYPEFHLATGKIIWGLTGKIFAQLLRKMGMDLNQWL